MILTLYREQRDKHTTVGYTEAFGRRLYTLERPWRMSAVTQGGQKGISCVPAGRYKLVPYRGESVKDTWCLVNPRLGVYESDADMPEPLRGVARSAVLIQSATRVEELRGCVALGKELRRERGEWVLARSRDALNEFRLWIGNRFDVWVDITEEKMR